MAIKYFYFYGCISQQMMKVFLALNLCHRVRNQECLLHSWKDKVLSSFPFISTKTIELYEINTGIQIKYIE